MGRSGGCVRTTLARARQLHAPAMRVGSSRRRHAHTTVGGLRGRHGHAAMRTRTAGGGHRASRHAGNASAFGNPQRRRARPAVDFGGLAGWRLFRLQREELPFAVPCYADGQPRHFISYKKRTLTLCGLHGAVAGVARGIRRALRLVFHSPAIVSAVAGQLLQLLRHHIAGAAGRRGRRSRRGWCCRRLSCRGRRRRGALAADERDGCRYDQNETHFPHSCFIVNEIVPDELVAGRDP